MSSTREKNGTNRISRNELRGLKSDKELRKEAAAQAKATKKRKHEKSKSISWRELTNLAKGNESIAIHELAPRSKKPIPQPPQVIIISKLSVTASIPEANHNLAPINAQPDSDIYSDLPELDHFFHAPSDTFMPYYEAQLQASEEEVNESPLPRVTSDEFALPVEMQHGIQTEASNNTDSLAAMQSVNQQTTSSLKNNTLFKVRSSERLKAKRERVDEQTENQEKPATENLEPTVEVQPQPEIEQPFNPEQAEMLLIAECERISLLFKSKPAIAMPDALPLPNLCGNLKN